MKRLIATAAAAAILVSCSRQQQELTTAGFIDSATPHRIVLNSMEGENPGKTVFAIDDDTQFDPDGIIEGNIAEVIYLPSEQGETATAISIITDATYPDVLGLWKTYENAALPVAIELHTCGRLTQTRPTQVLTFTRWQLEGTDNTIMLFGRVTLPGGEQSGEFATRAVFSREKGKKLLTLKPDNGRETKLYFVE